MTGETTGANLSRSGLETQLFGLKQREQELAAKMKPSHPAVAEIRAQRAQMEEIIEQQVPDRTASTQAPNPLRELMRGEMLREQANVAALTERKNVLTKQLADVQRKAELLNAREVELAELQRTVTALESKFKSHVEKLEEARIDKALQADSISSINVIQPATFVERPVSPVKKLGLAAGVLLAFVAAIGTALVLETTDPTVRSEQQIEDNLDLPVLAAISENASRKSRGGFLGRRPSTTETVPPYQVVAGRISGLNLDLAESGSRKAITIAVVNCDSDLPNSIAAELAVNAIGMSEQPVLLVDADNVRRRAGDRFGANGAVGLSDVLSGDAGLEECLRDSGINNLSLLTSGTNQSGGVAVDLRRVRRQLEPVAEKYSLMIADLPASSQGCADVAATREFDAVLLVVEAERTRIDAARKIKKQLADSGANVLGCILHGRRDYLPRWLNRFV